MSDKQQPAQPQYVAPPYFQQPHDDEIDLRELFAALWQGKWWVIGLSMLCMLVAAAYAFTQPNVYRAQAIIAPVNNPFQLPREQQSPLPIHELATALFSQTMTDKMADLAQRSINVATDVQRTQGTIQLSAEGTDPAELLNRIQAVTETVDTAYKSLMRQQTEHSLNVLNSELKRVDSEAVKVSLGEYTADQTYKLAMLNHPSTQLIQVVKPATEPTSPIKPKRKLITVLGFLLGGMLGVAIVLVRFAFKREDTE
ncbi:hypothetical protein BZG05_15690 [Salinivibrio kushneri]|uniref:Wzz/FepE/Etk N-terminal domain-containing protein n=1 Tax=Salinivibrio kushneri TaxID=1908198 RepID=UPI0009897113|nr:Wzz/FepE/Etk N-terminal domain-containing protein [Salinivibrio kushneri]OOE32081.1 hypothetical protein BZG05_15690 [Salinivibrio kushneri]